MTRLMLFFLLLFLNSIQYLIAQNEIPKEKNHALKFDVFAPMDNHIIIGYEQYFKPHKTFEGSLGIIGIGKKFQSSIDNYPSTYNAQGGFLKLAYKTLFKKGWNPGKHKLGGTYLKYEIGYVFFKEHISQYTYPYYSPYAYTLKYHEFNNNIQAFSMMVLAGQQFVIKNFVLVNFYGGIGALFDNRPLDFYYEYPKNDYITRHFNDMGRFSINFGMSVGFLF